MEPLWRSLLIALLSLLIEVEPAAAQETRRSKIQAVPPFSGEVLTTGLESPWEITWGPDGFLWITERVGKRVTRVDPTTGEK